MKSPKGISFYITSNKYNEWKFKIRKLILGDPWPKYYDNENNKCNAKNGFMFSIVFGTIKGPIPKFWERAFWSKDYLMRESKTNPWNSGNHWFVLHIPIMIAFFFSCVFHYDKKQKGFYIGCKSYLVDTISSQLIDYTKSDETKTTYIYDDNGTPKLAWGSYSDWGKYYLYPSVRTTSNPY